MIKVVGLIHGLIHAIKKTVTVEWCKDKVSSAWQPHLPDGLTVCVLNDAPLLIGSVALPQRDVRLLFPPEPEISQAAALSPLCADYNELPQTGGKALTLLCKHPLCIWRQYTQRFPPHVIFRGNCRQTYSSAKDNPASFAAAVKNRYKNAWLTFGTRHITLMSPLRTDHELRLMLPLVQNSHTVLYLWLQSHRAIGGLFNRGREIAHMY